jgi:hypothetical protein
MGFMDKAKKLAEQAQGQAEDGTLEQRAKTLAVTGGDPLAG